MSFKFIKKASVIIPLYNPDISFLFKNLKSLVKNENKYIKEIILVDDGSRIPVKSVLGRLGKISPKLKIIRQKNRGAGAARNTGVRISKSDIVAFLDWDCSPDRKWLQNIIKPIVQNRAVGVGGKILTKKENNIFSEFSDFRRALREPIKDKSGNIIIIITANAAFSKEIFDKVGGFDPKFKKAGGEDLDLTYKLIRAGYLDKLVYQADAVVKHKHRSNLVSFLKQQFNYGFWDMFHFLYRKRSPLVMGVYFPTLGNIFRQIRDNFYFSIGLIKIAPYSYGLLKKFVIFPLIEFVRRFAVMLGGIKCYYFYAPKVLGKSTLGEKTINN